jgi:hypothetical protein
MHTCAWNSYPLLAIMGAYDEVSLLRTMNIGRPPRYSALSELHPHIAFTLPLCLAILGIAAEAHGPQRSPNEVYVPQRYALNVLESLVAAPPDGWVMSYLK